MQKTSMNTKTTLLLKLFFSIVLALAASLALFSLWIENQGFQVSFKIISEEFQEEESITLFYRRSIHKQFKDRHSITQQSPKNGLYTFTFDKTALVEKLRINFNNSKGQITITDFSIQGFNSATLSGVETISYENIENFSNKDNIIKFNAQEKAELSFIFPSYLITSFSLSILKLIFVFALSFLLSYFTVNIILLNTRHIKKIIYDTRHIFALPYAPYFFLYTIIFLLHLPLGIGVDDIYFSGVLDKQSVLSFMIERTYEWSSRIILEVPLIFLAKYDLLFRFLNPLVCVFICLNIKYFANAKTKTQDWFIVILFFAYMLLDDMASAGWVTTYMNYLWPLAFGMYALIPIKKILINENFGLFHGFTYTLATIYSASNEQMSAVLLGFYGLMLVYAYFNKIEKNEYLYIILQVIIAALSLLFVFLAPGNEARTIVEANINFPEYAQLSVLSKIIIGISATYNEIFFIINPVTLLFSCTLFFTLLVKKQNKILTLFSLMPLYAILVASMTYLSEANYLFTVNKMGFPFDVSQLNTYLVYALILLSIASMFIPLYAIFEDKKKALLILVIMFAGLCSRMIMIASPSIWASTSRTFIFYYFAIIQCAVFVFVELSNNYEKPALEKINSFRNALLNKEISSYILFGLLTTVLNIIIYALCAKILSINYLLSTIIAWILSIIFAYYTNRKYVFKSTSPHIIKEAALFILARLFSGVADISLMWIFVDYFMLFDLLAKIYINIFVILLNYILSKSIIFKQRT